MNREELVAYVNKYGDSIFVRAEMPQMNGSLSWQSVPISEVSEQVREEYIQLWRQRGIIPVRMVDSRQNLP